MTGVYAVSWRFSSEPQLARHWAYYLSSDEMKTAMARADQEDAPIVVRSACWLPVDTMLVAQR
jgi:hypothetical protein